MTFLGFGNTASVESSSQSWRCRADREPAFADAFCRPPSPPWNRSLVKVDHNPLVDRGSLEDGGEVPNAALVDPVRVWRLLTQPGSRPLNSYLDG